MSAWRMLFAYGFRIFFVSAAAYAAALMAAWTGVFTFGWTVAGTRPLTWHAHEMLMGVAVAAIAGFLLTAVPNWTKSERVHGKPLAGLWLLWLAGRLGYWLVDPAMGGPAAILVHVIDLAFLPVLAVLVARPIVASGNRRNLVMVALLAGLFAANLALAHPAGPVRGQILALDLVTVMMIIIGGRITPLFTRNWLNRRGLNGDAIRSHRWLDIASIVLTAAVLAAAALDAPGEVVGVVAMGAGLANLGRLLEWQGWRAWRDPLVWVLHLGYAWIAGALILRGFGGLTEAVSPSAWVHAAGVGAMGTLIVGVMARVSLGHTGRTLRLPTGASSMFWLMTIAAAARTGNALGWFGHGWGLSVAGAAWIASFVVFIIYYLPILVGPRVDGRPG